MKNYKATQLLTFKIDKVFFYLNKGEEVELQSDNKIVKQLVFKGYLIEVKTTKTKK